MRAATFAGCGAIALWSMLGLLSRAAASLPPLHLTAMAFCVSAVLGAALLAVRGELGMLRQPGLVWAHGVFGLFGFHALYFAALAWAPPAEANLINYLWPLFIVLFSAALPGMRLSRWHLAGVGCGVAGCALLPRSGASLTAGAVLVLEVGSSASSLTNSSHGVRLPGLSCVVSPSASSIRCSKRPDRAYHRAASRHGGGAHLQDLAAGRYLACGCGFDRRRERRKLPP